MLRLKCANEPEPHIFYPEAVSHDFEWKLRCRDVLGLIRRRYNPGLTRALGAS